MAAAGALLPVLESNATEHAEGRNYLQYIPATPFVGSEETTKDYMRFREPVAPWKVSARQPTWEEVMSYRQKLDALRDKSREIRELEIEQAPKPVTPSTKFPAIDTTVPVPPLKLPVPVNDANPIDVTVSPWFNIQTPPPPAPQSGAEASGGGSNGPAEKNSSSIAQPPEAPGSWIKKPINGTDVYIPYSSLPGVNAPPTTSTAPSAVIYSQPKAAGSQ